MKKSLVSVIIPVYNCADFLAETLDTVTAQTYQEFEVIIVDDGSTDNTKSVIEEYQTRYPQHIRCFSQANAGISVARNAALQNAQGEYVAFLDSDDLWTENKLQEQLDYLKRHPEMDLVFTNSSIIDAKSSKTGKRYTEENFFEISPEKMFGEILLKNSITFSSVLLKKSVLDTIGPFDSAYASSQDTDLLLRVTHDYRIGGINKNLVKYRIHDHNISLDLSLRHQNSIHILEKYMTMYPEDLKPLQSQLTTKLSLRFYDFGYSLFAKGKLQEARTQFIASIKHNPFAYLKKYFYLVLTFLPLSCLDHLKRMKGVLFVKRAL